MSKRIAKLVHFGLGGHGELYGQGCTCSGYDRPDTYDYSTVPDGTPVLDKRPALDSPEGLSWVFKGPICDPDLSDEQIDRCPKPSPLFAGAMAEGGGTFGMMVAINEAHDSPDPGPLDSVSVPVYIAGWVKRGARYGIVEGGKVVWQ